MPEKDAKDYADSIHAIFVETSAKNAININEVFIEISECISPAFDGPHICALLVGRIALLYVLVRLTVFMCIRDATSITAAVI